MKTFYAIVNVQGRQLGTYVPAEEIAGAFETARARYKMRHPRLQVQTIAVQEMAAEYDARLVELLTSIGHDRKLNKTPKSTISTNEKRL
jgi:hypothetical protein